MTLLIAIAFWKKWRLDEGVLTSSIHSHHVAPGTARAMQPFDQLRLDEAPIIGSGQALRLRTCGTTVSFKGTTATAVAVGAAMVRYPMRIRPR
jgi:hypothetical protein